MLALPKGGLVFRLPATFAVIGALALLLSGCSTAPGGAASSSPSTSVSPAATPAASGPCVADPAAVTIARLPPAANDPMPSSITGALDAAVSAALPQAAAPGAIVAVQSPQGTWVKAFGVADPNTGALMTATMHQRVGSVTKTFTGTLVLQLAQEGKIRLDDPIDRYVVGMPNGSKVTVRQLLNMTSGLASYTLDASWQKTFFSDPYTVWRPDQLVATAASLKPIFAPGAQYNYSNTNTVLLGKIVERVTGQPVERALEQRIIEPLGLTQTSFPGASAAFPAPHSQGFTLQSPDATPDHRVNATNWNPSWGWTAGEVISNAHDLLAYGRALGTGQGLLSAAEQDARLTSFPSPRDTYSYGLAMGCVDGWVGHTGELPGFNTTVYYQTDSDTTVAVLTNSDIASGDCSQSMTLTGNSKGIPCSLPAGRVFTAVAAALGHPFTPPTQP